MRNANDKFRLAILRLAAADRLLMNTLITSHGAEFAAIFRVDFAEEVTRAAWFAAKQDDLVSTIDAETAVGDNSRAMTRGQRY